MKTSILISSFFLCFLNIFSDTIPIDTLIKKPNITGVSLSLDGKYVAALYTDTNDQQLLLTHNVETGETKKLREPSKYDIYSYSWASNTHLVYKVGENKLWYIRMGSVKRDMTDKKFFQPVRWNGVVDPLLNDTNNVLLWKKYSSTFSKIGFLNIHTGRCRKKRRGFKGYIRWWDTDMEGNPRLVGVYKKGSKGKRDVYYRKSVGSPWKKFKLKGKYGIYGFTTDTMKVYVAMYQKQRKNDSDSTNLYYDENSGEYTFPQRQFNTRSLYIYNLESNKLESLLFSDSLFDFNGSLYFFNNPYDNPENFTLKGLSYQSEKITMYWFDENLNDIQKVVDNRFPGCVNIIYDADTSLSRFLIYSYSDIKPPEYQYYNKSTDKVTLLFKMKPWINPELMSPMRPISFFTRDSLKLFGYLTEPKNGKAPFPTVVLSHGGPHARDVWCFNTEVQTLANNGYAVLQVNYRGSTGYGYKISKEHEFSFHQMHEDVIDATKHFIDTGIVDPHRVAIMGTSFGGYLSISCVVEEPQLYRCAISNAGVFDWEKHIRSKRAKYKNYVYDYYRSNLGKSGSKKEYLEKISPIHRAKEIKTPILLCGGFDDRNVSIKQSVKLKNLLTLAGNKPEMYFKANERHGFEHQRSIGDYYRKVISFLDKNLKK
jgi:dipeptidyl aminopeptidase/acylaminoacyl peptidase